MKKLFLVLMINVLLIFSCDPPKKATITNAKQGISGLVNEEKGNRMPMVGAVLPAPKGIAAMVLVYAETNIGQVARVNESPFYSSLSTKKITSVQADSSGRFYIQLPVGTYSLFIKKGNHFYANRFDEKNNINTYKVETGKLTKALITISDEATY